MTNVLTRQQRPRMRSRNGDVGVAVTAVVAAVVVWTLWTQLASVDLRTGSGEIGVVAVAVTALVASGLGIGLVRLLARRRNGLRLWSVTACAAWVLSLLGPLSALSPMATLALASLHLVVGVVVILGVRRVHAQVGPVVAAHRVA